MAAGIVPRAISYIWSEVGKEQEQGLLSSPSSSVSFSAKCSFFEIYQEKVYDLLDSSPSNGNASGNNLQVHKFLERLQIEHIDVI
jgi:hypothetical protein